MECYKVLSKPSSTLAPNYKGLHRSEPPFPKSDKEMHYIELMQKYDHYYEESAFMGITTELTLDELKFFASLATQNSGERYEVIFFSENKECSHQAEYYGIDVTGVGGYSMLGENIFIDSVDSKEKGIYHLHDVINQHFRARLNANGLFNNINDAISFRTVLNDLNSLSPGCVEEEDWQVLHIFKVL